MASTNKTTHYELSQFLGTDKPAWLSDYNSDMAKIDAGVYSASSTATSADGKADSANTAIGTLSNLSTDVKTDLVSAINEVDGHADTAQGTANEAQTTANSANTKVDNLARKFNLNNIKDPVTWTTNLGTIASNTTKCVYNSDGTVGKFYGFIGLTNSAGSQAIVLTSSDTGLRPETSIDIYGNYLVEITRSDNGKSFLDTIRKMTVGTDGKISITLSNAGVFSGQNLYFIATILFMDNFGD